MAMAGLGPNEIDNFVADLNNNNEAASLSSLSVRELSDLAFPDGQNLP